VLRVLSGAWTPYILWVLHREGPLRFGALRQGVPGISARLLSVRLRQLELAGLVTRRTLPTGAARRVYALTTRGRELRRVIDAIDEVAQRWEAQAEAR
jgi:DNA-binding HxlR family transcriptional regulator